MSGVRVKGLEWSETTTDIDLRGGAYADAPSILGTYMVWGDGTWRNGMTIVQGKSTLADGKAAAQAEYEQRILSALTPDPAASADEAEGFVLVPKEPTPEMVAAGYRAQPGAINSALSDAYRAMIAVTPSALASSGEGEQQ